MNDGDTYMCIEDDQQQEQKQKLSLKSMVMQGKWAPVEYENDLLTNIKTYYEDDLEIFSCEFTRPYAIEIPKGTGNSPYTGRASLFTHLRLWDLN